jgi:hypothetical protein
MLSENNFPSLSKSKISKNDTLIPKPIMKYSDVLKQKKTNVNNTLKINEIKNENKTDSLINIISEKTKRLSFENNKTSIENDTVKPKPQDNVNNKKEENKEEIQKKYQNNIDSIIKIQKWWRLVSKIRSMKNMNKEKEDNKENEKKENIKKEPVIKKTLPKKPSFSDIVKLTPPQQTTTNSEKVNTEKLTINSKKSNNKKNNNNNNNNNNKSNNDNENNNNVNSEKKLKENERKNQNKSKKVNEELNSIFKNMKFMGLIEKEIDDLTEKNTIVNGKQFAKTKVITIKKYSRNNSSSTFSIDDINDNAKETKKKGGKNENKTKDKKSLSKKKNVCFNEKDEVFNEYNHVMKKLDLHIRCDKKSCLIDCYRRLYKREWEDDEETSEESSNSGNSSNSESEDSTDNTTTTTTLNKKSDYLYNDIYNPNYSKYYSGSDFDFGNRYFTGKERLKKALHLEPVEVTVQKIIYQPMKFKQNKLYQQKKKNSKK